MWTGIGHLLDLGCSFGEFLAQAKADGWTPHGLEPNRIAAQAGCARGFDVRCEWILEKAGFEEQQFSSITAIDSFCFVWNPYEALQTIVHLLQPKGVLAMRVTNKHVILKGVRASLRPGHRRNDALTGILKGQFHAISVRRLVPILRTVGFDRIEVVPQAMASQWQDLSLNTRLAYSVADTLYALSLGKVNLSPGVLLFARKAP